MSTIELEHSGRCLQFKKDHKHTDIQNHTSRIYAVFNGAQVSEKPASDRDRKTIFQTLMASAFTHDGIAEWTAPTIITEKREARVADHYEILSIIDSISHQLCILYNDNGYQGINDGLSKLGASYIRLDKLSGINQDTFMKWYYESFEQHFDIIKINKDRYVGKKETHYAKEDSSARNHDLYFVLEKLNQSNIGKWNKYRNDRDAAQRSLSYIYETVPSSANDDGMAFETSLNLYKGQQGLAKTRLEKLAPNTEVWVAYATENSEAKSPKSIIPDNDIEMVFSVFFNNNTPITSHMGISRNAAYFINPNKHRPMHANLAMQLHGFSAKAEVAIAADNNYTPKLYMITTPLTAMRQIMIKAFKNEPNAFWSGSKQERKDALNARKSDANAYSNWTFIPPELDATLPLNDVEVIAKVSGKTESDCWTLTGTNTVFQKPDWLSKHPIFNMTRGGKAYVAIDALARKW